MKLKEIFDHATHGELSQLHIGGAEQGEINEANWQKVLSSFNLGLTALHTRFALRIGKVVVQLLPNQEMYVFHSSKATSTPGPGPKYLLDLVDPFKDNLLKVQRVITAAGHELGLNNPNDCWSVHTPSMNALRVPLDIVNMASDLPFHLKTVTLDVHYHQNHPKLVLEVFDPSNVEVELPETHVQALLYYVASRHHNPAGMTNEFNAGNNWYAKYEAECMRLENEGMEIDQLGQPDRIRRGGWA